MPEDAFKDFRLDDGSERSMLPLSIVEQILVKSVSTGSLSGIALGLGLETPAGSGHKRTQWFLTKDQAKWLIRHLRMELRKHQT